jgi:hypothetical protein
MSDELLMMIQRLGDLNMEASAIEAKQILQNRMAADRLCQQLLDAHNALGAIACFEDIPHSSSLWAHLRRQSGLSYQAIGNLKNQCFQTRQDQMEQLPSLSNTQLNELQALNQKLLDVDKAIAEWLIAQGIAKSVDTAIKNGKVLDIRFDIDPQFHLQLSHFHYLCLRWQIPFMYYEAGKLPNTDSLGLGTYHLGRWAGLIPCARSELTMLTSPLLNEMICFVPELGFVAKHVTQLHLVYGQNCFSVDLAIPSIKAIE